MNWLQAIGWGVVWLVGIVYLWVLFMGATSAIEILERQKRRSASSKGRRIPANRTAGDTGSTPVADSYNEETGA